MANWELILRRDDGTALALIDSFALLRYSLLTNDVSALQIDLGTDFDTTLLAPDRRLEVWREPSPDETTGQRYAKVREGVWLIRKTKDWTDDRGVRKIEVTGYSANYLLTSRIVAYASGTAQAKQTDYLDDMMKAVVNQNFSTGATSTARQLSTVYLQIAPDLGAAPSKSASFAWRNCLEAMKDLAEASKGAGTDLFFELYPFDSTKFEFRTYTGQIGIDHTYPSGVPPVLLGLQYGNLSEPSVEQDWSEEASYIYCGGQGEGSDRTVVETEDTARSGRSVFGRREYFQDARDLDTSTGLTARAQMALAEKRPRLRFSGKILDVPGTKYGVHWRHGDRVSALYQGQQYDCLIRSVQVWVSGDGQETIESRLEVDE